MTENPADIFDKPITVREDGLPLGNFPGPVTRTETRLSQEVQELTEEVARLKALLKRQENAADFWYKMFANRFGRVTE